MRRSIIAREPLIIYPLIYGLIFFLLGVLILLQKARILILLASLYQIILSGYNVLFVFRLILNHNFSGPESMLHKTLIVNIVCVIVYSFSIYYFIQPRVKEQFRQNVGNVHT
jgi:hypothetical protein